MKIVDLHCDTVSFIYDNGESLWENTGHFDIKRALYSNIGIQFFALFNIYPSCDVILRNICKQMDKFFRELEENQQYLYFIKCFDDINKDENAKKIGCILHLEGGEALGTDLEILRMFYKLGLRSLGLTWNYRNHLADGVGEDSFAGGISKQGREVIKEMDKMGIILDLSHISTKGFYEALSYYERPVMVTHANARALCNHKRNLDDSQLKALASNGGIIGINQVSSFVTEQGVGKVDNLLDHIVYIAELIGIDHVALGSDFDGADSIVMSGVEEYNNWEELLFKRGFSHQEIGLVLHGNALRVMKAVLR